MSDFEIDRNAVRITEAMLNMPSSNDSTIDDRLTKLVSRAAREGTLAQTFEEVGANIRALREQPGKKLSDRMVKQLDEGLKSVSKCLDNLVHEGKVTNSGELIKVKNGIEKLLHDDVTSLQEQSPEQKRSTSWTSAFFRWIVGDSRPKAKPNSPQQSPTLQRPVSIRADERLTKRLEQAAAGLGTTSQTREGTIQSAYQEARKAFGAAPTSLLSGVQSQTMYEAEDAKITVTLQGQPEVLPLPQDTYKSLQVGRISIEGKPTLRTSQNRLSPSDSVRRAKHLLTTIRDELAPNLSRKGADQLLRALNVDGGQPVIDRLFSTVTMPFALKELRFDSPYSQRSDLSMEGGKITVRTISLWRVLDGLADNQEAGFFAATQSITLDPESGEWVEEASAATLTDLHASLEEAAAAAEGEWYFNHPSPAEEQLLQDE